MATSSASEPRPGRTYAGVPIEARREQRRDRLIRAGLDLFGTRGIANTRVDDICNAAGLTKRYFYESFETLDALVEAVVRAVIADLATDVIPAIATHGWRNPRPALDALLRPVLADPRLVQLLVVETNYGSLAARRAEMIDLAVDTWLGSDPHTEPKPQYLATQRLLAHAMAGATGEVALAWTHGRVDLTVDEVIDHLERIFRRITPTVSD